MAPSPEQLLILAGTGQLTLACASLAIPRALGWREETQRLSPLTRGVFWTYAAYIWGTNVALGLVSILQREELAAGRSLGRAVCAYAALYWGARLVIQFATFGKHAPDGARFRVAEAALVALFLYLTAVYLALAAGWIGGAPAVGSAL